MPSYEHSLFYYLSKLPSSVKHHPLPFILLPCFSISPFFLFIVSSNLHILSSFLLHLYPLSSFPPSLFPLIHRSLPFILLPCSSLPLFFSWSPHSLFPEIFRIVPPPPPPWPLVLLLFPLPSPYRFTTLPRYHSATPSFIILRGCVMDPFPLTPTPFSSSPSRHPAISFTTSPPTVTHLLTHHAQSRGPRSMFLSVSGS